MVERSEKKDEERIWIFVRLEKTPTPKSLSPLDSKLLKMGKDERQSQSSNSKSINQSNTQQTEQSKQTLRLMTRLK